ncbi:MAG: hypothetical protein ABR585_10500 [Gemmatimonadaceae bacterium]
MSRAYFLTLALASFTFACDRGATSSTGLAPVNASAAATAGQSVTGSGTITFGTSIEHISVSTSGNSGRVTFQDKAAGGNVNGQIDVNCVNIVDNTATISGIVTHSNDHTLEGREGVFQVVDNGNGTAPDFASIINFHELGAGTDCSSGEFDLSPVKGNFTVQD